eukprot:scaffold10507_cov128-Cylindrotheca_fusiformis.AAC.4
MSFSSPPQIGRSNDAGLDHQSIQNYATIRVASDSIEERKANHGNDEGKEEDSPGMAVLSRTCSLFSHFNVNDLDENYDKTIFANFVIPPKVDNDEQEILEKKIVIPDRCVDSNHGASSVVTVGTANHPSSTAKKKKKTTPTSKKKTPSTTSKQNKTLGNEKQKESWSKYLAFAQAHFEENGTWNMGNNKNRRLRNWIKRQRQEYRSFTAGEPSPMTLQRIEKLNAIGFEWEPRTALWMDKYDAMHQYWSEHRHTKLPRGDKRYRYLKRWCARQRNRYWEKTMDPTKIAKLNAIDFDWHEVESGC